MVVRSEDDYLRYFPTGKYATAITNKRRKTEEEQRRHREQLVRMGLTAGKSFRDCPDCPEMVVLPEGNFLMGSSDNETGREKIEGPQHRVMITKAFALGKTEITVGEFRKFVAASGDRSDAERNVDHPGCNGWKPGDTKTDWHSGWYWDSPGFPQDDRHPAACLSWNDAKAYVVWLAKSTNKSYRLPSEAEWEYAARAGTATARYWGDEPNHACRYANGTDTSVGPNDVHWPMPRHECNDGYFYTAPVASYAANVFGLYDMIGNVWEWVEDCYHDNYSGAPTGSLPFASLTLLPFGMFVRQVKQSTERGVGFLKGGGIKGAVLGFICSPCRTREPYQSRPQSASHPTTILV